VIVKSVAAIASQAVQVVKESVGKVCTVTVFQAFLSSQVKSEFVYL
jgi:hypothetical protein